MIFAKNVALWRVLAGAWASMILFVLLLPGDSVPTMPYWPFPIPYDKTVHAVLFFVQAVLLRRAITLKDDSNRLFFAAAVALATSFFGATTEGLQLLAVARSASVLDAVADLIGASTAAALMYAMDARAQKRSGRPGGRPL